MNLRKYEGKKVEEIIRALIECIGEDPEREGLLRTPQRASQAMEYFTQGYDQDAGSIISHAIFEVDHKEMVVLRNIDFYSLCEHHLVPFFGKCHIAYLPKNRIVGLSKLPRVVDVFARRLQVQERMTTEIAETLEKQLDPYGVAVVIEAMHLCLMMRGVEKQNAIATTSAMLGSFKEDTDSRMEFLNLIGQFRRDF